MAQELKVLHATHLEAARMIASGRTWRDVADQFEVPGRVVALWRRSSKLLDKIEEYRHSVHASAGKAPTAKEAARKILESHAVKAAEKLGAMLESTTPKQQLDAAKDILDRTGVVLNERVGNIVINITAADMARTEQIAKTMGLIDVSDSTRKALPEPVGAPA